MWVNKNKKNMDMFVTSDGIIMSKFRLKVLNMS